MWMDPDVVHNCLQNKDNLLQSKQRNSQQNMNRVHIGFYMC